MTVILLLCGISFPGICNGGFVGISYDGLTFVSNVDVFSSLVLSSFSSLIKRLSTMLVLLTIFLMLNDWFWLQSLKSSIMSLLLWVLWSSLDPVDSCRTSLLDLSINCLWLPFMRAIMAETVARWRCTNLLRSISWLSFELAFYRSRFIRVRFKCPLKQKQSLGRWVAKKFRLGGFLKALRLCQMNLCVFLWP